MEPLGSALDVVDVMCLKRWHQIAPRETGQACPSTRADSSAAEVTHQQTPFPINEVVNKKVALWYVGNSISLLRRTIPEPP